MWLRTFAGGFCRSDKTRQRRIRHQHGACAGCGGDALSGLHSA
ncbi:hypothetical protein HMPREF9543_02893 [Escherichia coli MS 146-1]|nr:hypothetical protein HMPREF9543_02893 [Escherichia coli MS 146-1]